MKMMKINCSLFMLLKVLILCFDMNMNCTRRQCGISAGGLLGSGEGGDRRAASALFILHVPRCYMGLL